MDTVALEKRTNCSRARVGVKESEGGQGISLGQQFSKSGAEALGAP